LLYTVVEGLLLTPAARRRLRDLIELGETGT